MPPSDERLVGNQQTAGRVVEVPPRHAVVRLVGHVAVVPAQTEVHRELRDFTFQSSWKYGAKYLKLNSRGLPAAPGTLNAAGWKMPTPE